MSDASKAYLNLIKDMDGLRILSIDFDVIMNDSLEAYGELCNSNTVSNEEWEKIKEKSGITQFEYSEELLGLIKRLVSETDLLICCEHHRVISKHLVIALSK